MSNVPKNLIIFENKNGVKKLYSVIAVSNRVTELMQERGTSGMVGTAHKNIEEGNYGLALFALDALDQLPEGQPVRGGKGGRKKNNNPNPNPNMTRPNQTKTGLLPKKQNLLRNTLSRAGPQQTSRRIPGAQNPKTVQQTLYQTGNALRQAELAKYPNIEKFANNTGKCPKFYVPAGWTTPTEGEKSKKKCKRDNAAIKQSATSIPQKPPTSTGGKRKPGRPKGSKNKKPTKK